MRILIVRTSAMGDVVHCLPALKALRRTWSDAHVGWVVEKAFAPLLEGHPDIDQLIPVRLRAWRRRTLSAEIRGEIQAAIGELRRFRADVAIDLMGNHKGALLALASGARQRLGASRQTRREPSSALWLNRTVEVHGRHAVDRALDLVIALRDDTVPATPQHGPVDFGGDDICPDMPPDAEAFLNRRQRPFIVIQAGAGWGNKTYPAAWWGQVAQALHQRTGVEIWVPIAPGEEHLAQAIVESSDGAARSVDAAPWPFLTALLRHSRLVLGGDTGPIHLAHALGTAVLCVVGPTDPERNGPYPSASGTGDMRVLWKQLPCSNCYRRFGEPKACLLSITPEAIVESALELLQQGAPAPGE